MKRTILTFIFTALICAMITIAQNRVNSPKIVSTIPTFGDCSVDPELTKIEIKFDHHADLQVDRASPDDPTFG